MKKEENEFRVQYNERLPYGEAGLNRELFLGR
jgi:hypothetical protein